MSSLIEYFSTDWEAMTTNDWIGTIVTVVVFFLMLGLYIYVLIPKNKGMEENKNIPIDDEQVNTGE